MAESQNQSNALIENDDLYIINSPQIKNVYSIYLLQQVGDSKNYRALYHLLRNANRTDTVIMYLNNYGGYVATGTDIVNAMRVSQANIATYLTGPVYSMAPLIALAAKKIFIQDDVFMMFHDYSGGSRGKGNEMAIQVAHEKPHFDSMFKRIVNGFLTAQESKSILEGKDLYLDKKEIIKRLKKIGKYGGEK